MDLPYKYRGLAKYELGDKQGAIADFTESINLNFDSKDQDNEFAYIMRSSAKEDLGDEQGSLEDCNRSIISGYTATILKNPNDYKAYISRGREKYGLGEFQGAIADFNNAISCIPSEEDLLFLSAKAEALFELQENAENIDDDIMEEILDVHNNLSVLFYYSASSKLQLGDEEGARDDYKKSRDSKARWHMTIDTRAYHYQELGANQKALQDLRKIEKHLLSSYPNSPKCVQVQERIKTLESL